VTESKQVIPFLIYLATIWSFALLIVPGSFMLVTKAASYPQLSESPAWFSFSLAIGQFNFHFLT